MTTAMFDPEDVRMIAASATLYEIVRRRGDGVVTRHFANLGQLAHEWLQMREALEKITADDAFDEALRLYGGYPAARTGETIYELYMRTLARQGLGQEATPPC